MSNSKNASLTVLPPAGGTVPFGGALLAGHGALAGDCPPAGHAAQKHYLTKPLRREVRLPDWFRVIPQTGPNYLEIRHTLKKLNLNTICEDGRCPNRWECWNDRTATFMILGEVCTRSCGFCAVTFGKPTALDQEEPKRLAEAIAALGIEHAVITSVNRDDLDLGGAEIFAETITKIKEKSPNCKVEILIPDFQGKREALEIVLSERPDVVAHNMETVPRLYRAVRPQAKYFRSLQVLSWIKEGRFLSKTGMMLGLGESEDEVCCVMGDLVEIGCDILTLGQYLQPTDRHLPVVEFVHPDRFRALKEMGEAMGIRHIEAGPLVRSSYRAKAQIPS